MTTPTYSTHSGFPIIIAASPVVHCATLLKGQGSTPPSSVLFCFAIQTYNRISGLGCGHTKQNGCGVLGWGLNHRSTGGNPAIYSRLHPLTPDSTHLLMVNSRSARCRLMSFRYSIWLDAFKKAVTCQEKWHQVTIPSFQSLNHTHLAELLQKIFKVVYNFAANLDNNSHTIIFSHHII